MIYLYLFGTCFHFIYVFMIIGNKILSETQIDYTFANKICDIKRTESYNILNNMLLCH